MKKGKIIMMIVGLFTYIPIWFFILYTILSKLDVDRLVWFLFWIYLPLTLLIHIVGGILTAQED